MPGTSPSQASSQAMRAARATRSFDAALQAIEPGDLATIIYTSGTTGDAKGVMLTHGNIASNLTMTTGIFQFGPEDLMVSFLPLSHVTARHIDYLFFCENVTLAYVGRPERVLPAMAAVKPTIFVAVPRVFERVRQSAEGKALKAGGLKARIFQWAIRTGGKHRDDVANGRTPSSLAWKLADKLVYSKLREAFGGRVKVFVAGGAPLGIDLARWFADAGIAILEGYGLTETSPVIAVNQPHANKLGTIGLRMPNTDCRFAEDGELEVRGPGVFPGYWQKPEQTAAVMDGEWFKTGDIGSIDTRRLPQHHRPQARVDQDHRWQVHCAATHRKQAEGITADRSRRSAGRSPQVRNRHSLAQQGGTRRLGKVAGHRRRHVTQGSAGDCPLPAGVQPRQRRRSAMGEGQTLPHRSGRMDH